MKPIWLAILALALPCEKAFAWGQEGHSIVAELAEHRLDQPTLEKIRLLLKTEIPSATQDTRVSLGSIASWADDFAGAEISELLRGHLGLHRGTPAATATRLHEARRGRAGAVRHQLADDLAQALPGRPR
jgi:hypothetical protein